MLEIENRSKLETKLESLKAKDQHLKERIRENYNTDFESVSAQIERLESEMVEMSEREVQVLRRELSELGPIYPESIAEYESIEKRYRDLNEQYEDLTLAEKNILETIESLNESMRAQFSSRFAELNERFGQIFNDLFEGGSARLECLDPEDILSSGIELIAKPPGKRLKSLNLLSGGEKAMTAIALLLSFIELNPAPFSILDEIDAALDENNIARFTKFLENMDGDNQFIIITHRKNTMRVCEQINGITMSSDGVSRLCHLNVSEYTK